MTHSSGSRPARLTTATMGDDKTLQVQYNEWRFWRLDLPAVPDEEFSSAVLRTCTPPMSRHYGNRDAGSSTHAGSGLTHQACFSKIDSSDEEEVRNPYGCRLLSSVRPRTQNHHHLPVPAADHYGSWNDEESFEDWNGYLNREEMGNLSSNQPGEKKGKGGGGKDAGENKKFRFGGKGEPKQKGHQPKHKGPPEFDTVAQKKMVESTPSPGSSMSSSVYMDTHSHLPTPNHDDDSIQECDSRILDEATATLQDASPGSMSDVTVFDDESKQEMIMCNVLKRPTQSLPNTPDTLTDTNFSTMTIYDPRYRSSGTTAESSSYSSGGRELSTSGSDSSSCMDIHDLGGNLRDFHYRGRGSLDSSTLPFTLTQHRKVVLPPTKFAGPPPLAAVTQNGKSSMSGSEECLRPANLYGTTAADPCQQSSPNRRHSSYGDVPPLDGNVLRKVASLTLDKATIDSKVNRPKFVPEKLDFSLYEKFEGKLNFVIKTNFGISINTILSFNARIFTNDLS